MKYIYESCEVCKEGKSVIGLQPYYCHSCEKFYESGTSEESKKRQKVYEKLVVIVSTVVLVLLGLTFTLPLGRGERQSVMMIILFLGSGFIIYKIHTMKLWTSKEKSILRNEISRECFKEKLGEDIKRNFWLIIIYCVGLVVGSAFSLYYGWALLLLPLIPLIMLLAYFPLVRMKRARRIAGDDLNCKHCDSI